MQQSDCEVTFDRNTLVSKLVQDIQMALENTNLRKHTVGNNKKRKDILEETDPLPSSAKKIKRDATSPKLHKCCAMKNCTVNPENKGFTLKRVPNCPPSVTRDDLKCLSVNFQITRWKKIKILILLKRRKTFKIIFLFICPC